MTGADHVHMVRFQKIQVPAHMFKRRSCTKERVTVMAVDSLSLHLLAVYIQHLILNLKPADPDLLPDIFVPAMQNKAV